MAFATASSPANRKPGANAQAAAPPQAQARPRQSPGKAEPPTRTRAPSMRQGPQRAGTKTGLRSVSLAKQRVPAAKNRQSCPAVVEIDNSSQPQGQNARLFALSESPHAYNRQKRPFLASETAKNRPFWSLAVKTDSFSHRAPTRQPNPMPNMQRSRHQSRRAFRKAQSQTRSR